MHNLFINLSSSQKSLKVCIAFALGTALHANGQEVDSASEEVSKTAPLRDPFNAPMEQVGMPIYAFGGGNEKSVYSDLIKVKVLALGENASGEKRAFLQLPKGEIISVIEDEWFTIQGSDLRITPITIKEISDSRLIVLVDKRSKFILR